MGCFLWFDCYFAGLPFSLGSRLVRWVSIVDYGWLSMLRLMLAFVCVLVAFAGIRCLIVL